MNKIASTLSLSAALMLGVASLSAPMTYAQDKDDKASSMKETGTDKAPPSSSSRENSSGNAKSADQNSESRGDSKQKDTASDKDRDQDKSKSASDQKDRNEKSASDKENTKSKNADRQDDKATSKQSETKPDQQPAKKADTAPASKSNDTADSKKPDDANRNADKNKSGDDNKRSAGSDTAKAEKAKSADLSGDKKDRVTTSFKSENVKKITNVNIDISVGRRLPRDWDYHSVPTAVIEIVPEYRGYRYAYVEDRYVIVDPDTYEVVYVLDDTGGGSASVGRSTGESGTGRCSTELTFSQEDRTFIFEKVHTKSASLKIGNLEIGTALPKEAKVEIFPSEVTTRVTKLDTCRYVVIDDKVAVVDPNDDKIVAIIED